MSGFKEDEGEKNRVLACEVQSLPENKRVLRDFHPRLPPQRQSLLYLPQRALYRYGGGSGSENHLRVHRMGIRTKLSGKAFKCGHPEETAELYQDLLPVSVEDRSRAVRSHLCHGATQNLVLLVYTNYTYYSSVHQCFLLLSLLP